MLAANRLAAQMPVQLSPGVLNQAQAMQAPVDVSQPDVIAATAAFDPPVVRVGEKFYFRVTVEAAETDVTWPEKIPTPAGLKISLPAHGQLSRYEGNKYRPLTAYTYETTATSAGTYTLDKFLIRVSGRPVEVPASTITVVASNTSVAVSARKLLLEMTETNPFFGQPFSVRVILPSIPGSQVEAAKEIQFNGGSMMVDKTTLRQSVGVVNLNGQPNTAFIYEATVTPLATGPLAISVQGFTASIFSAGPISITASGGPITLAGATLPTAFLVSDEVHLNVRSLPMAKELSGFTGTMGKFITEKPMLATNRLHVGEPVHLKTGFRPASALAHFVPPEVPRLRDWQVIADNQPGSYTLIPLTDEVQSTPAIPFCGFDPATGNFYDLTIPSQPVTIIGESLPSQFSAADQMDTNVTTLQLSALANAPGRTVASLKPLQLQGWFVGLQLLPVAGFIVLWRWDARRRFLEAHPDIAIRRKAKRELRRELKRLDQAAAKADTEKYLQHAMTALYIAIAPQVPANARAMAGGDVLTHLHESQRNGPEGALVLKLARAWNSRFAATSSSGRENNLLDSHADIKQLLVNLEGRL